MSGIEASPPDIVEVPELDPEVVPAHVEEEVDGVLEEGKRINGFPGLILIARNVLFPVLYCSRTVLTW